MHEQPQTEKSLQRIERIAEDINSKFAEAIKLAGESARSGQAAVVAAIECGKMLIRAKEMIGYGNWLKWLSDNCPDFSDSTAQRWMTLAKNSNVKNLTDCRNLSQAYIACGILPERQPGPKGGIGTGDVDIVAAFIGRIEKLSGFDLSGLPDDRKEQIRSQLRAIEERL